MGQLSLLRYMMFKCSKVSLQSLLQPQCRSIVLNATSAGAGTPDQSHSTTLLEDEIFKKPALIAKTEIQPALTLQMGTQSLVSATSAGARTAQPQKKSETSQSQSGQRKSKLIKTVTEPLKKDCPLKLCATASTKTPVKRLAAPAAKKPIKSILRGQKVVKLGEAEASIQEAILTVKRRSGSESRTAPQRSGDMLLAKRRAASKRSSSAEARMRVANKQRYGAIKKPTAPVHAGGLEAKTTSEEMVMIVPSDSKGPEILVESAQRLQSSHTDPSISLVTPEMKPSKRSVTFADTVSIATVGKPIAQIPITPAQGCNKISMLPQSTEVSQNNSGTSTQNTAPPTEFTPATKLAPATEFAPATESALATEVAPTAKFTPATQLINLGESINSSDVTQETSGQSLVLDTVTGQMTCIGLETVVADRIKQLDPEPDTKTAIAKAWSIFSPENRLRRLIEENSDDVSSGARTIRRTSSVLENGIRQIRRRLPSIYHHHPLHPADSGLLPFRDTLTSLARRDYSLRKIKALRIIEECGGTIPSPARISIDRQLQNEYRDNRASILKIKFVTNQWVVPRYIMEHFEKFHKPPFQPNGNVDEKRITESVTIVLKLSQTLFLTNTTI